MSEVVDTERVLSDINRVSRYVHEQVPDKTCLQCTTDSIGKYSYYRRAFTKKRYKGMQKFEYSCMPL